MRKTDIPGNLLGIFAHEDDEVIGAGGLFLKNVKAGGLSKVICFGGSSEKRKQEFYDACNVLSIEGIVLGYDEGYKNLNFEKIKTYLINEVVNFKPDFIITHDSNFDYHPDHKTLFDYVFTSVLFALNKKDALDIKGILTTETHMLFSEYHVAVDISSEMQHKRDAMAIHVSQLDKSLNYYMHLIEKKAELRGLQTGVKYAESFRLYNIPIIANISGKGGAI